MRANTGIVSYPPRLLITTAGLVSPYSMRTRTYTHCLLRPDLYALFPSSRRLIIACFTPPPPLPPPRPVDELWRDVKHRSPRSLSLHGSGLSLHLSVGMGFMRTVDDRSPRTRYALLPMLLRISFLLRSPLVLSLVDCTWSLSASSELLMWVMGSERTPSFLPACGHGSIVIWIHALICSCHAPAPLLSSAHH